MKRTNAFTLIEIMMVIGVIGLLAALATFGVMRAMQNSYLKRAETELHMIATAMLQLAWDTSMWPNKALRTAPGSAKVKDISVPAAGLLDTDGTYENWKGPYYDGNTKDPWGNNYYFDPANNYEGSTHVVVGSFGPDGIFGGDEDPRVPLDD